MGAPFGATSTTDDVLDGLDLSGMRVLVTGVSAGLGVETARALSAHGAKVIGTARDLEKGRSVTGGGIDLIPLDLGNLASVRARTAELLDQGDAFDIIIANAGVMATPFGHTADGFETQFGTNHLGHFVFVNRIASLLRDGGRLVNVSSAGHRFSNVDLDDPGFERTPYDPYVAYGRSKTANILFAVEFDKRHSARGIRAAAVHPGIIKTELARYTDPAAIEKRIEQINENLKAEGKGPLRWKSLAQGAATSVWAAIVAKADEVGGKYCEDCHIAKPMRDDIENIAAASEGVRAYALDLANAAALWKKSEELVGESFHVTAARTA